MKRDRETNNTEPTGEFASSIRDFRAAVTHIANRETARPVLANWLAPAEKRQRSHQRRLILGWACAALLCCATLPLATHSRPAPARHIARATAMPAQPGAALEQTAPLEQTGLLEQVDEDVSESVPSSLAPLAELDSWNAASNSSDSNGIPETTNAAH